MRNKSKKPLNHGFSIKFKYGIIAMALFLFAGCNLGGSGQGSIPTVNVMSNNIAMPPEISETKELMDTAILDGLTRKNMFSSLLLSSSGTQDTGSGAQTVQAPPPVQVDPFDNFSLAGIIYRGNNKSLAIFITPTEGSKILHEGDFLLTSSSPPVQIQVTKIDKKSVSMQVINPTPDMPPEFQTKKFDVVSLVGFKGSSSASTKTSEASGSSTTGQQSSSGDVSAMLEELKKSLPASETGSPTVKQ